MPPKPAAKASKKKGLTEEEKQAKTLEYLHETLEPTTVKDLIKVLPKAKGIPFNTVEACLKALLGDDLIVQEKVGINTLVWSFPATTALKRQGLLQCKQQEAAAAEARLHEAEGVLSALQAERCDPEREGLLAQHRALVAERDSVLAAERHDVENANIFDTTAASARHSIACANVHTENLRALVQHAADMKGVSFGEVLQLCDIPKRLVEFL